jgi:uncharacterized protein (TIGR00725 family)
MSARAVHVAVVGGDAAADDDACAAAFEVGRQLARRGCVLVCGGLGGVMEAACRGAAGEGGLTVGLLPGSDRTEGNPHLSVAIATGMGEMRNALVVRAADVVIAIGGGHGTLSEIAFALKTGRAVIGLGTWDLARAGAPDGGVIDCEDPAGAVESALSAGGIESPPAG